MKVTFFGNLSEIVGDTTKTINNFSDVNSLQENLFQEFPSLKKAKYRIAVNNSITSENLLLNESDEIAFLPPFAGG